MFKYSTLPKPFQVSERLYPVIREGLALWTTERLKTALVACHVAKYYRKTMEVSAALSEQPRDLIEEVYKSGGINALYTLAVRVWGLDRMQC